MVACSHVEIISPGTLRDGQRVFFVDLVDADGGRLDVWQGTDYDEAILVAGDISAGDLPVIDLVVG